MPPQRYAVTVTFNAATDQDRPLRDRRGALGTGTGSGRQLAMDRAHRLAFSLSVMPGNSRRTSMAADSSPSRSKTARIAAASDSVTTNMAGQMVEGAVSGKPKGPRWLRRYGVTRGGRHGPSCPPSARRTRSTSGAAAR
jgi:hypothetical protein